MPEVNAYYLYGFTAAVDCYGNNSGLKWPLWQ